MEAKGNARRPILRRRLAPAYVAYRCNSWLVPMILHAATGLTVLALIWLWPT